MKPDPKSFLVSILAAGCLIAASLLAPGIDGTRAIGTILDPNGPVIGKINKGEAFYGDARVLGKPYVAGYEPIRDAANQVIGIYFVGYAK